MARWQTMFSGVPTADPIIDDGQEVEPMGGGFNTDAVTALIALAVGVTQGAFDSLKAALEFFGYSFNYVGAA